MKALSIRQPWAHAILHLGKRVENRDWQGCAYRGPVLLHASKTLVLNEFEDAVDSIIEIEKPCVSDERDDLLDPMARWDTKKRLWRPAPTLPFGGIVGRARIVDVLYKGDDPSRSAAKDQATSVSPWWAGGFALVLADVEPLPFIPWKGSLGFFEVPDEIVERAVATALKLAIDATGRP